MGDCPQKHGIRMLIDNLVSLQILNVSCNFGCLNALLDSMRWLCSLVELDARFNQIKTLPDFIGRLGAVEMLNAQYKRLYFA